MNNVALAMISVGGRWLRPAARKAQQPQTSVGPPGQGEVSNGLDDYFAMECRVWRSASEFNIFA